MEYCKNVTIGGCSLGKESAETLMIVSDRTCSGSCYENDDEVVMNDCKFEDEGGFCCDVRSKYADEPCSSSCSRYKSPQANDDGLVDVQQMIREQCQAVSDILVAKNEAYGNSALDPVRVFSRASTDEQLNVRIDDKLSRLMRGDNAGEDVTLDLIGYLILKRVWEELNKEEEQQ